MHIFSGNNSYYFDELQLYGQAQLAVLTDPPNSPATMDFANMIGDRTGAIHVGQQQTMDLLRHTIDLPFSVHVYAEGHLGLAPTTIIHDVDIHMNGSLWNVDNLTLHHGGELWLYSEGRTEGLDLGMYQFNTVHIQTNAGVHILSDPVTEPGVRFEVSVLHVDGGGLLRGTDMYIHAVNITVDAGGSVNSDGLGYRVEDGSPYESDGETPRMGLHGILNPGTGMDTGWTVSGAGHGGSGGRGNRDGRQS